MRNSNLEVLPKQHMDVLGSEVPTNLRVTSARAYTVDELADIYNQTRVDYIVPMPMDGKRMAEYIRQYDVHLDASSIVLSIDHAPHGIGMLGVRGQRSWITRLGVLPTHRGHKLGQYLMELCIEQSKNLKCTHVQLEVIKGNQPALQLFKKLNFVEIGELLVIRRPPTPLKTTKNMDNAYVTALTDDAIQRCLTQRKTKVAWTEETASLSHISTLKGFSATLPSGEVGWLIYQFMPMQLTHIIFNPDVSVEMAKTLLQHLHSQHPFHDTKVENVPSGNLTWDAFAAMGYIEVFRRIEMQLTV